MMNSNLRKVKLLLDAFEKTQKSIIYYALDLSLPELERTLNAVKGIYEFVECRGLLGTYDDGLEWLKDDERFNKPKCVLWMGSSIGNLTREDAASFLQNYSSVLRTNDTMIIGIDACQDKNKVFRAYNDSGKSFPG